ncbi:MAG TPA: glycosyltransferase [Stellaceae bacterium]|nr:glycosyltransferase [Stellaceae bacterium]
MTLAFLPPPRPLRIVVLGLSITSSWGNGHATTYRSLLRGLRRRGHTTLFLERDAPWYAANRDPVEPECGPVHLYGGLDELHGRWRPTLESADLVIVGSYVADGIAVAGLVRSLATGVAAFYDIDTPVTLAGLAAGDCPYLDAATVPLFDLYLSFTGGPALRLLETRYGARAARVLYCAVDPDRHRPQPLPKTWDLGYLGTYSEDRQPAVERLLCEPARRRPERRFVVAGPLYPADLAWPPGVERIEHVGPDAHAGFYSRQRFTLNLTRADMARMGYSPSVRLFEAAACGVPVISDWWPGLDTIFTPGEHILIARSAEDVLSHLCLGEDERRQLARRARAHVLNHHTAMHRAQMLEQYVEDLVGDDRRSGEPLAAAALR